MQSRSVTWTVASLVFACQTGCWLVGSFDDLGTRDDGTTSTSSVGGTGDGGGTSTATTSIASTASATTGGGSGGAGGSNLDCEAPSDDCDGSVANGCETRLDNDPENCGVCGHDCLVGECVAYQCMPEILAAGECAPKGVALLGERLMWANYSGCPEGGRCNNDAGGCIRKLDLASGGSAVNLVEGLQNPTGIAVHLQSIRVFWTEFDLALGIGEINATIVDDPDPIDAVAHSVGEYPEGLAVGGGRGEEFIYWTDTNQDAIFRVPFGTLGTDGALVQPFATTIGTGAAPIGVVADGDEVFWAEYGAGRLARAEPGDPEDTGVRQGATWLDDLPRPWYVTFDGAHVYWTDREEGTVNRKPRSGDGDGDVEVLYRDIDDLPSGIAVDETFVYWANRGGGTIVRLAK